MNEVWEAEPVTEHLIETHRLTKRYGDRPNTPIRPVRFRPARSLGSDLSHR